MCYDQSTDSGANAIEVRGLSLRKGEYEVLNEVSFALEKGKFAALVGPSGCGKTSLLRVLALLDQPHSGVLRFWGEKAEERHRIPYVGNKRFYPRVTFVPQTLALWPHLTLRENALFATDKSAQVHDQLNLLSRQLDVTSVLSRKPLDASQGQRQRCALIRALLLTPTILLLDEITAALDEDLAKNVWALLRAFARDGGSILASTHGARLAAACDYSYRIRQKTVIREKS